MVLSAMTDQGRHLPRESQESKITDACSRSKDLSERSLRQLSKTRSSARSSTQMRLSSPLLREETHATTGSVKVRHLMKLSTQRSWELYSLQVLQSILDSKKVRKLKSSGIHLEARLSILRSRIWALLLVLSQDCSIAQTLKATST